MTPLLAAGTTSTGRRYLLVVGLYTLGVTLFDHRADWLGTTVVHQPIRSIAEAADAVAVARALML